MCREEVGQVYDPHVGRGLVGRQLVRVRVRHRSELRERNQRLRQPPPLCFGWRLHTAGVLSSMVGSGLLQDEDETTSRT